MFGSSSWFVRLQQCTQTYLIHCDQLATNHATAVWCRHLYTLVHSDRQPAGVSQCSASRQNEVWRFIFTVYGQFFEFPSHRWHWWQTYIHMSCTCNSDFSQPCDIQTSITTSVVDVNWAIVVIKKLGPPSMLFMTPQIPPPVHCHRCWPVTTIVDGHKLSAASEPYFSMVKKCNFYLHYLQ